MRASVLRVRNKLLQQRDWSLRMGHCSGVAQLACLWALALVLIETTDLVVEKGLAQGMRKESAVLRQILG